MFNIIKKYKTDLSVLLALLILSGILGITQLKVIDWDWFSTHYYNPWAFLNNRIDTDFMPSFFRTYFNPFLQLINYATVKIFNNHPYICFFVSNFKYGLTLFLTYKFAKLILQNSGLSKQLTILFTVILTATSPMVLHQMNFEYTDLQIAIPALLSLYIFVKYVFIKNEKFHPIWIMFSAFLLGAATGFKGYSAVFCIAMLVSILLLRSSIKNPYKTLFIYLAGIISGFALSEGIWAYTVYQKFKNPFFPYFNNIFKSDYADLTYLVNLDHAELHKNKTFFNYLFFAITEQGFEMPFFDLKYSLGFICIVVSSWLFARDKLPKSDIISWEIYKFLIFYTAITFYLNVYFFSNYRYMIIICCLIPLILAYIFDSLSSLAKENKNKIYYASLSVVIILCVSFNIYTPWNSMAPFRQYYAQKVVDIEKLNIEDNATVLMGTLKTSFLIPEQNPKAKYIAFVPAHEVFRPEKAWWYVHTSNQNMYYLNSYLEKELIKIFNEDKNPLYFVYSKSMYDIDEENFNNSLNYYSKGMYKSPENCNIIRVGIAGFYFPDEYNICKFR